MFKKKISGYGIDYREAENVREVTRQEGKSKGDLESCREEWG